MASNLDFVDYVMAQLGNAKHVTYKHGAKPHFLVEEKLEDRHWLTQFITVTSHELPEPKIKKIR